MRYLTVEEVLELHHRAITISGGSTGVRDLGAIESAVAQPQMSFGGQDLYVGLAEKEKAATLGFALVCNHPFIDGNKRIGHAAMETFLVLNGFELQADVNEQESVILGLAAGGLNREQFPAWVASHVQPIG